MKRPIDIETPPEAQWPLGAHLVTPRWGYTHHGIYVGNGRVVHYGGWSRALLGGPVEEVSLAQFAGGREVTVRTDLAARYPRAEIVDRARSRLGEDRYRLASNNCEHFCAWCVSGESRSAQIERLRRSLARAVAAATRALREGFGLGLRSARGSDGLAGAAFD